MALRGHIVLHERITSSRTPTMAAQSFVLGLRVLLLVVASWARGVVVRNTVAWRKVHVAQTVSHLTGSFSKTQLPRACHRPEIDGRRTRPGQLFDGCATGPTVGSKELLGRVSFGPGMRRPRSWPSAREPFSAQPPLRSRCCFRKRLVPGEVGRNESCRMGNAVDDRLSHWPAPPAEATLEKQKGADALGKVGMHDMLGLGICKGCVDLQ